VTGADIEQTAGIAIVLLVAGAGMVRVNRRRNASAR
jgi:LPXTG-motif cell wall-anchored protein